MNTWKTWSFYSAYKQKTNKRSKWDEKTKNKQEGRWCGSRYLDMHNLSLTAQKETARVLYITPASLGTITSKSCSNCWPSVITTHKHFIDHQASDVTTITWISYPSIIWGYKTSRHSYKVDTEIISLIFGYTECLAIREQQLAKVLCYGWLQKLHVASWNTMWLRTGAFKCGRKPFLLCLKGYTATSWWRFHWAPDCLAAILYKQKCLATRAH